MVSLIRLAKPPHSIYSKKVSIYSFWLVLREAKRFLMRGTKGPEENLPFCLLVLAGMSVAMVKWESFLYQKFSDFSTKFMKIQAKISKNLIKAKLFPIKLVQYF